MDKSAKSPPMFQNVYLDCNQIGVEGCRYLAQAKWTHLQVLDLSKYFHA